MAFRPQLEPASYLDEGPEPDPFLAGPQERVPTFRGRGGRAVGSHALPKQRRSSTSVTAAHSTRSAQRASGLGEGSGRGSSATSIAAELAGWASGELPGQASRRLAPRLPPGQYRPMGDGAALPNVGLPSDTVF